MCCLGLWFLLFLYEHIHVTSWLWINLIVSVSSILQFDAHDSFRNFTPIFFKEFLDFLCSVLSSFNILNTWIFNLLNFAQSSCFFLFFLLSLSLLLEVSVDNIFFLWCWYWTYTNTPCNSQLLYYGPWSVCWTVMSNVLLDSSQ